MVFTSFFNKRKFINKLQELPLPRMNLKFTTSDYLKINSHAAFGSSFRNWYRLHRANKFDVDLRFLPKILFITMNILSSAPLRMYERMKFNKKIKNIQVKQPLFILGYYRSGTTFLHYLLSKDPRFGYCATYEVMLPHIFLSSGSFSKKIMGAALPENRPMDNLKMGADLPKEEEFALASIGIESVAAGYFFPKRLQEYFNNYVLFNNEQTATNWKQNLDYFLKKVSYKYGDKPLVIKSPANTGRIKQILELYPDAKFIHIHRNPYQVYLSNERLYEKILPMLAFHKVDNKTVEEFIFNSYFATYNNFFEQKQLIKPENLFEFSYDDFTANPVENLRAAYSHLGYADFEETEVLINKELLNYKNYETNKFNLSSEIKEEIYKRWEDVFRKLNYAK